MENLFSVIIPVYNVEKYLKECLDSVLSQTFDSYEIILIDDGSTDESGDICDEYCSHYSCISVIHQYNQGLSAARNVGIHRATGEYIVFVDSDDMLNVDALKTFSNAIEKNHLDIYIGSVISMNETSCNKNPVANEYPHFKKGKSGRVFLENALKYNIWVSAAQFNIYRKQFVIENNIFFKKGLLHEDELWTPQIFLKASEVEFIDYPFYFYRLRGGSITSSTKPKTKNAKDLINTCIELENISQKYIKSDIKYLKDHLAVIYMNAVSIGKLYNEESVSLSRTFPINNACKLKNVIKSLIFYINPKLYCELSRIF